jgi:hypothetical protein
MSPWLAAMESRRAECPYRRDLRHIRFGDRLGRGLTAATCERTAADGKSTRSSDRRTMDAADLSNCASADGDYGHIWPLNSKHAVLILPSLVHHRYTQVIPEGDSMALAGLPAGG